MNHNELDLATIKERVLVVDDDIGVLNIITRQLTGFGLQADQAENGREALALLQKKHYGLVITDMVMPEMDGMELLLYVRSHYPQVDVLVVSGYSAIYKFTDLVSAGATDFIAKPFDRIELQAKMQRIFRERLLLAELVHSRDKEKTFFLHIVESLAISLDGKDEYTHGHSRRVTNLALQLAEYATEEEVDFELLRLCGLLHDIGKIGVPDKVLGKVGKLSDEEWLTIRKHPELGAQILKPMESDLRIAAIAKIIKHHHERYDGKGYPDGLKGKEIPYLSRILAVADSYDAMTSDRPYRTGMDINKAMEEIRKNSGSQFDPVLAAEFISFMKKYADSDPCPSLDTCFVFSRIAQHIISTAYEMQYCRANFEACARYKIKNKKERPDDLLPDGSILLEQ
ncbi:MAG: response regulator [Desulfobulbaceae bacterium]|jgi:putative two-component system response regulator|nr:response regulator [Desulfobulbaceae bacterium]